MYDETLLVELTDNDKEVIAAFASCKSKVDGDVWLSTANNGSGTLAIRDIIGSDNKRLLPVAVWYHGKIFAIDLITWLIDEENVDWSRKSWREMPGIISRKHIAAIKYLAAQVTDMEMLVLLPPVYDKNSFRFRFPTPDESYRLTILRHRQIPDNQPPVDPRRRTELFIQLLSRIKSGELDVSDFFYDERFVECELLESHFTYLNGALAVMQYTALSTIPPELVTSASDLNKLATNNEGEDKYTTIF